MEAAADWVISHPPHADEAGFQDVIFFWKCLQRALGHRNFFYGSIEFRRRREVMTNQNLNLPTDLPGNLHPSTDAISYVGDAKSAVDRKDSAASNFCSGSGRAEYAVKAVNVRALTPKQDAFCVAYLETGNASEAYRRVYVGTNM